MIVMGCDAKLVAEGAWRTVVACVNACGLLKGVVRKHGAFNGLNLTGRAVVTFRTLYLVRVCDFNYAIVALCAIGAFN